jgi:hypothetical protein
VSLAGTLEVVAAVVVVVVVVVELMSRDSFMMVERGSINLEEWERGRVKVS